MPHGQAPPVFKNSLWLSFPYLIRESINKKDYRVKPDNDIYYRSI